MTEPKRKKRKFSKPPRCVLLDTRQFADLNELTTRLEALTTRLDDLTRLMLDMGQTLRQLAPLVSQMHDAQQKRSNAARKANATRQAAPAPIPVRPTSGFEAIVLSSPPGNGSSASGGSAEVNPPIPTTQEGEQL